MKYKLTVTVGIPAYNEEINIRPLLKDILKQNRKGYLLSKILVISDGSTDKTTKYANYFNKRKITVLENSMKMGISYTQNRIIKNTFTDILLLLNSDIRIFDKNFIEKLILPITNFKTDLVAAGVIEMNPTTIFEKALLASTKIKNYVYEKLNYGNNVYTCRGVARAFSKRLYKEIRFEENVGEDAFSYFFCKQQGFNYLYSLSAKVSYKLPDNFSDHKNQSLRFFRSQKILKNKFGKAIVAREYNLPKLLLLKSFLKILTENPGLTLLYFFILGTLKLRSVFENNTRDYIWNASLSSKKI